MRKIGLNVFLGALLIALASSCLDDNNYEPPTFEEDQAKLKTYLDTLIANNHDVDTTALGVYYVTMKEGSGDPAKAGDTLKIGYAGYLINGQIFDASAWHNKEDSTYTFILEHENSRMIRGFEDGLKVMNKGAKVQMIIPSQFAYGSFGTNGIPPNSSVIFVVQMKDIKPAE